MNPSSENHLNRSAFHSSIILILTAVLLFIQCDNIEIEEKEQNSTFYKESLEIPKVSESNIFYRAGFCFQYSERHEQAVWVAYLLTCEEVFCTTSRTEDFRSDTLIFSGSSTNDDYQNSGFIRGHLKPAADSKASKEDMSASFLLSNISPMSWRFNEGLWLDLENKVREWTILYDSLFIVTGPILTDNLNYIGSNQVSVPQYFYKALIDVSGEEIRGIAFLIPHIIEEGDPMDYAITIDSLESVLNLDLFYNLPDSVENIVESDVDF